jgi:hypothetical protein
MRGIAPGVIVGAIDAALQKLYAVVNPTKSSETASFDESVSQLTECGNVSRYSARRYHGRGKRSVLASLTPEEVALRPKSHQQSLAAISPQGKQIIAERSGHFVQNDHPKLVVDAIREVVADWSTGVPENA